MLNWRGERDQSIEMNWELREMERFLPYGFSRLITSQLSTKSSVPVPEPHGPGPPCHSSGRCAEHLSGTAGSDSGQLGLGRVSKCHPSPQGCHLPRHSTLHRRDRRGHPRRYGAAEAGRASQGRAAGLPAQSPAGILQQWCQRSIFLLLEQVAS